MAVPASITIPVDPDFLTALNKFMADVQRFQSQAQRAFQQRVATAPPVQPPRITSDIVVSINKMAKTIEKMTLTLDRITDRLINNAFGFLGKAFMRGLTSLIPPLLDTLIPIAEFLAGPIGWTIGAATFVYSLVKNAWGFMRWVYDRMTGLGEAIFRDSMMALGTGASIGGVRAFRAIFGGLGLSDEAFSMAARGRGDPTSAAYGLLKTLGIRNTGDTADILAELLIRGRKFLLQYPADVRMPVAKAAGLEEWLGRDLLVTLPKLREDELREMVRQYQEAKKAMQLTPEAVKGWNNFSIMMRTVWVRIEKVIGELIADPKTGLMVRINALTGAALKFIQEMLKTRLTERVIDIVAGWIKNLTKYMESDEPWKWMRDAKKAITSIIKQLDTISKRLNALLNFINRGTPYVTIDQKGKITLHYSERWGVHPGRTMTPGAMRERQERTGVPRTRTGAGPPSTQDLPSQYPVGPAGTRFDPISATSIGGGVGSDSASRGRGQHQGVDLMAPVGSPVYADMDGTIVKFGSDNFGQPTVTIRHADGTYSRYLHMQNRYGKVGDQVHGGQQIGTSGSANGVAHLHFERWQGPPNARGSRLLDPMKEGGWDRKTRQYPRGGQPARTNAGQTPPEGQRPADARRVQPQPGQVPPTQDTQVPPILQPQRRPPGYVPTVPPSGRRVTPTPSPRVAAPAAPVPPSGRRTAPTPTPASPPTATPATPAAPAGPIAPYPQTTRYNEDERGTNLYQRLLTEFRAHPPSAAPSDGARFGIVNNTPEEWARFGTAVAAEESGFRPGESRVTSRESSYGIFQYDHNQAYGNAYDVDNSVRAFVRDSNDAANSGKLDGSTLARRFSTIGGQYWWRTVRSLPRAQKIADRAGAIPTRPTVTRPQAWTGTELQKVVRPGAPGTPSGPAPVRPAPIETTPEALRPGMPGTPGGPAPERPERPIAPERPERPTTPQVPGVSITGFSQAFPGQGLPGPEQNNQATSVMGMARGRLHAGGDYYAPIGTPLQAQGDGKVVNISDHNTHGTGNYGHTVVIQYDNGYTVQYSHLNPDSAKFKVGDKVTRGEVFAESGASGTMAGLGKSGPGVTPPHVHTEVVKNEHYKGGLVGGVGSPSRRYVLQPEEVFQFGKGGKNIPQTTVPVAPSASSQPSDQSITPSASSQPSNAPINQVEPDSTTGEAKGDEVTGDLPSGGAAAFLTKQFKELSGQREAGDRSLVGFSQEARNRAKASMTDVAKTYPEPKKEGATFEGPIDRSDVAKEIEDNPALKKRLAWMMRGEVDHYDRATWEQKQTQLESALNRYQLRKKEYAEHPEARPKGGSGPYTLEETLQTVRDPPGEGKPERYYAKDTYKAEVEPTNEQVDDFVKQHLEPALKGSNVGTKRLKFTPTGNSSIGVAEHHKLHGDPYGTVDGPELYELDANDNPNFSKYAPGPEKGLKHLRTRRPLSDFSNPPEMEKRDVPLPRSRPKEAPQEIRVNNQHSDADVAVHKNPRHHHDGDAPSGGSDKDTAKGGGESKNLNIGDNGESHSPELDS